MEEKRLTRTDYLFSVLFICMLVSVLGAFFFGLRTGQLQVEAKYQKVNALKAETVDPPGAYEQQALVSFYHTIYLPYREFEQKWFQSMDDLELQSTKVDAAAKLKELNKTVSTKYVELQGKAVPPSSPLLADAQQNFLKGLKLFGDAAKDMIEKANSMTGPELVESLANNANFAEASDCVLTAQKDYFDAIVKWNQIIDANYKPVNIDEKLTFAEWGQLSLNSKNDYIASMMKNRRWLKPFMPQDVTLRVDEFASGGESKKLNINDVGQAVQVLIGTDAIRPGDFIHGKQKFYKNETLPQVPFFTEQG